MPSNIYLSLVVKRSEEDILVLRHWLVAHYNGVMMGALETKSPASQLSAQPSIQAQINENIKAPLHTGDPLHSRALAHSRAPLFTQPCTHCSHSRAPREQ